ncbi:unnamed protein product [Dibothriocephalus latus]|uniref:Uncharacterized protein n=1 Tax=Dibothriocephalus latus TaxID=60516 RepID=A0A3P7LFC7_DIBLA|nr:unnamed protein product [Dibothriocephalus latus]
MALACRADDVSRTKAAGHADINLQNSAAGLVTCYVTQPDNHVFHVEVDHKAEGQEVLDKPDCLLLAFISNKCRNHSKAVFMPAACTATLVSSELFSAKLDASRFNDRRIACTIVEVEFEFVWKPFKSVITEASPAICRMLGIIDESEYFGIQYAGLKGDLI